MRHTAIMLPLLALAAMGCSSSQEIVSRWGDRGSPERWSDSTVYLSDQHVAVGVRNDAEYLYLTLVVPDRSRQRQLFGRGMTVWFDYKGGEDRRFGVRYPIGFGAMPMEERPMDGRGAGDDRWREFRSDSSFTIPEQLPSEMEIYGPMKGERQRVTTAEGRGVEVTIEERNGTLYYRMQVPLRDNGPHLYAIGTQPGATIGVGIENGVPRGEAMRGGRSGGRGGGGRMGPPGGFGGGQRLEPMNFWTKVKLSEG
jgi:hypothetical protein